MACLDAQTSWHFRFHKPLFRRMRMAIGIRKPVSGSLCWLSVPLLLDPRLQWGDQAGGGAGGGFTSSSPLCPTAAWTAGESLVGPPATWTVGKANLMPLFSKADLISA